MSESRKALVQFGIIICGFIIFFAWMYSPATYLVWIFRIVPILITFIFILLLVQYYRKKDLVPDYLLRDFGRYFERDGFCFSLRIIVENKIVFVEVGFQNRYDQCSKVHIGLKFFSGAFESNSVVQESFDIECPSVGYGIIKVPLAIPGKYQGKQARAEVGADVYYPKGKGKLVRYRDGIHVGRPKFTSKWTPLKVLLGILFVRYISKPAYVRFTLPADVKEKIPDGIKAKTKIIAQSS